MQREWKTANGKPVANQELWQDIDRELAKFDSSKLKFKWLRSMVSDAGSDFVDSLLTKRMAERPGDVQEVGLQGNRNRSL